MSEFREEPPPTDHRSETPADHLTVPDVIREVFTNFSGFAPRLLEPRPPALLIMVWLIGMDAVAGTIEMEYVQRGTYLVDNWFYAWLRIIVGGALMGVIRYWLVGSLFNVGVRLAGGDGLMRTSRYIFLYAAIPVAVVDLALKVVQMLIYRNQYFIGQTSAVLDGIIGGVMLGTWLFTVRLMYKGMCQLMGADRRKSIALIATVAITIFALMIGVAF